MTKKKGGATDLLQQETRVAANIASTSSHQNSLHGVAFPQTERRANRGASGPWRQKKVGTNEDFILVFFLPLCSFQRMRFFVDII